MLFIFGTMPAIVYLNLTINGMTQVAERLVDLKKLRKIFSDNKEVMEQVMMGLILAVHDKAPALKRYYENNDWDNLEKTSRFLETSYMHVASPELIQVIEQLRLLVGKKERSEEIEKAISEMIYMAGYIVKDIEYYLQNL